MKRFILPLLLWISLFPSASVYAQELEPAAQQFYLGFGPGFFSNLNSGSVAAIISPGVMWTINPSFDVGVFGDMAFSLSDSDARFISPQLKGRYMFTESSENQIGYYVGGGLGFGYAHSQSSPGKADDSVTGFASSLAFGLKAFRSSSLQVSVELENQFIWKDGLNGTPNMTFLKVALHFF